jgi:hypothetical protein
MAKAKTKRQQYLEKIPFLKPGTYTALRVLRELQKAVRQEPRRIDMADWQQAFAGKSSWRFGPDPLPQCGTVACAAGWLNILTGHQRDNVAKRLMDPGERALLNIGLGKKRKSEYYAGLEFIAFDWADNASESLQNLFSHTELDPREVVQEIDRIIATHRKSLLRAKAVVK